MTWLCNPAFGTSCFLLLFSRSAWMSHLPEWWWRPGLGEGDSSASPLALLPCSPAARNRADAREAWGCVPAVLRVVGSLVVIWWGSQPSSCQEGSCGFGWRHRVYYGPCRYGLAPFGSLGRPRLFACTHLFIVRDLPVATAVSLALQPVKVYYHRKQERWDLFVRYSVAPKYLQLPGVFTLIPERPRRHAERTLQKTAICTCATKGQNKASKQTKKAHGSPVVVVMYIWGVFCVSEQGHLYISVLWKMHPSKYHDTALCG